MGRGETMNIDDMIIIVVISLVFICGAIGFVKYELQPIMRKSYIPYAKVILVVLGALVVAYLFFNLKDMQPHDWVLVALYAGLVGITLVYAVGSHRQAEASYEMAKEMRKQGVMNSRPIIIQRAMYKEDDYRTDLELQWIGIEKNRAYYFSHFEAYNEGNGAAIEVEMSLLNEEKKLVESIRETILRKNENPLKFRPSTIANLKEDITYYIITEYQSILSREIWYQTWLPFTMRKSSQDEEIFITAGELEFNDEVSEKDLIDAFSSRSKPR
jgi:multisubunit Na+/H+ antiporter MnhG subunit